MQDLKGFPSRIPYKLGFRTIGELQKTSKIVRCQIRVFDKELGLLPFSHCGFADPLQLETIP